ncbi:MAG: hypothetical protein ACREDE_10360 [Thermoplasmata archaeon]
MAEDRWSRNVRVHRGALERHGWREHESEEKRHAALRRSAEEDGYATTIRRLNFLRNVANRRDNSELRRVAHEDERWLERMHGEGMV